MTFLVLVEMTTTVTIIHDHWQCPWFQALPKSFYHHCHDYRHDHHPDRDHHEHRGHLSASIMITKIIKIIMITTIITKITTIIMIIMIT